MTRDQTRLDPLAEAPHRELIRRLAAAGDRGAAVSAYNRLRERLAHELRIPPSPATRELIAAISAEPSGEEQAAPAPRWPTAERAQGRAVERARAVVGRMPERAALFRLLDPGGPIAIFVYGGPGVGKSALLRAFAVDASARDAVVIHLDGETIEPSEAGFVNALGRAMGKSLTDVVAATEAVDAAGERVVVTVDACDRLAGLDAWLRDTWLPTLGDHVRLVIAGRRPPVPQWTARYGPLLAQIGLDTLSPAYAAELLRRLGVPRDRATRVNRVLRGHPLALQLAASTAPPVRGAADSSLRLAVEELARLFLADLDLETRKALETASVIRRVTRSLLRAMLAEAAPEDAMERLQRLPFVWPGSEGLIVFHVVRSVVAYQLRSEDPTRYRRLRTRAWRQLRHELSRAPRSQLWRYGADILYLSDSPGIRDAFFPNTTPFHELRPAQPRDIRAIEKITQRHEPRAAAEFLRAWWQTAPEAFTVAQGQDDAIAAFSTICEPSTLSSDLLERDPVAATWTTHQRAHPLPNARYALYVRHLLTA
jgi:hypothetical protein